MAFREAKQTLVGLLDEIDENGDLDCREGSSNQQYKGIWRVRGGIPANLAADRQALASRAGWQSLERLRGR